MADERQRFEDELIIGELKNPDIRSIIPDSGMTTTYGSETSNTKRHTGFFTSGNGEKELYIRYH